MALLLRTTTLRLSAKRHRTLPLPSPFLPLHYVTWTQFPVVPVYPNPSLRIGNSSRRLATLDRGVKVSNGDGARVAHHRGNGCTYTVRAETVRVLGFVSSGNETNGVSTALHRQYSLVGNDFYWKIYSENKYVVSRSSM